VIASRIAPLIAIAAIGCSPFDPDLGPRPFLCGLSNPRCPEGYVCVDGPGSAEVCALPDSGSADAGGDAGLQCSVDSDREPNGTTDAATMIPIPQVGDTDTIDAVLCPETDVDVYALTVDTTGKAIRVDVTYDASFGALGIDLVNSTGLVIRSATEVNHDPDHLRVEFDNLASDIYYAKVQAMGAGFRANYQATFVITSEPLPP
jgi:hypothetical protein